MIEPLQVAKAQFYKAEETQYPWFMLKNGFIIACTILLITACNRSEETDHLLYWSSSNAQEITYSRQVIEQWNQNHPDQLIQFQPIPEGQSSEEIILASVVGKTTPDIYANMWQGSVEMFANAGVLIPLDTLKGFTEFINERCSEEVIEEITSADGHIYQVPWKANPIITLYNKGLLESAGVSSLPKTYSQYLEAGAKLQIDEDNDGYVDRWIGYTTVKVIWYQRLFNFYPLYLAASDGAPLIKDNKAVFNNEFSIGVFLFLQELYNKNYFSRQRMSASSDPFVMEKFATLFTGPWQIPYLNKFKPDHMEYGFFSMLVPDDHEGPVYTYGDPKNIVIFNTCDDPQTAWEFVSTMVDRPGDLKLLEITGQFPRRKQLSSDPFFAEFLASNPQLDVFAHQVDFIKGVDTHPLIVEILDIISQEYEASVIFNTKTAEDALADAEKAVNVLLGN